MHGTDSSARSCATPSGSAERGGRRSAAKAIIPMQQVREAFGDPDAEDFAKKVFQPLWEAAGFKA